jgi:hypothetical protein
MLVKQHFEEQKLNAMNTPPPSVSSSTLTINETPLSEATASENIFSTDAQVSEEA